MANYKYVAYSPKGKKTEGVYEAETREQVADYLHEQGLTVVSITEDIMTDLQRLANIQIGGLPIKEKVIFAKQLSLMLASGVPVVQALRILADQQKNISIKDKLRDIYTQVESGNKLSDAFTGSTFFNEVQLNLIAAGEKSGNLNIMLEQVADDLEKSKNLRGKIQGAMIYPVIIFIVLILVMVVVLVFMVPSVKDLYSDLGGGELPGVTQLLVNISGFFTNPFGIVTTLLVTLFSVIGFRYYYSTKGGRNMIDKMLLKMPIFGSLLVKIQLTQFCRLLSMLMKSGVPIIEAMNVVAKALGNATFRNVVENAAIEVTKGTPISVPLASGKVFPEILLKIIATGEDTGNLDQVLADMGKYYANEVDEITSNLTKLMEPIILLIVGGMVGFIAIAVYLPIYSIGQFIN
jgi:type IV pilus assembly protein PilC